MSKRGSELRCSWWAAGGMLENAGGTAEKWYRCSFGELIVIEFKNIEFPEEVRRRLVKAGATPLAAMMAESGGRVLRLILSDDPMQSKSCVERHLSVSAWNNEQPSRPTFSEVTVAVQATGIDADTAEFFGGQTGGVVHLFAKQ